MGELDTPMDSQSPGAVSRSLLQDLRASAAKQAENTPTYAYGLDHKPRTVHQKRNVLSNSAAPAPKNNGRALDLANESPRIDALTLTNKLNHDLSEKQARLEGICPVRREVFSNCFDDIIRRVTHDCTERGLMLQRIRDQFTLTTDAYRTVFEGSVDRVTNTAWESDEAIGSLQTYIATVEEEVDSLQNQVNTIEAQKHQAANDGSELLSRMREEHTRKLKSIEDNNTQIDSFILELKKTQSAQ